jgi:hypothetical protein
MVWHGSLMAAVNQDDILTLVSPFRAELLVGIPER